jgi:hypothetical protein
MWPYFTHHVRVGFHHAYARPHAVQHAQRCMQRRLNVGAGGKESRPQGRKPGFRLLQLTSLRACTWIDIRHLRELQHHKAHRRLLMRQQLPTACTCACQWPLIRIMDPVCMSDSPPTSLADTTSATWIFLASRDSMSRKVLHACMHTGVGVEWAPRAKQAH